MTFLSARNCSGLLVALSFLGGVAGAQPASITTKLQPFTDAVYFGSTGEQYYFGVTGPLTPGAVQTQNGGGTCLHSNGFFDFPGPCDDAYVAKVDPTGKVVFGTFLGGSTDDQATAVVTDAAGNVFVAGSTGGSFPATAKAANATGPNSHAFVAKLSPDGSRVLYATYLPDTAQTVSAIALDSQGDAFVTGISGTGHAYVVKVSADGTAFLYTVVLAGTNQESALADSGTAVVAGQTNSSDFPVSNGALQVRLAGEQDVFVTKLDPAGKVMFSTYLGGSGTDAPAAVQLDSAGNVYVAGRTTSFDFPTTAGSLQPSPSVPMWNNAAPAGFVAKLSSTGNALHWGTYVMSANTAVPNTGVTQFAVNALQVGVTGLSLTPSGDTYITGLTGAGFPVTPTAPQVCFQGANKDVFQPHPNAFVARLDSHGALLDATYAGKNVGFTSALSLTDGGTVLLAADSAIHQIRFGGRGVVAQACLSTGILDAATLSGGSAVVPGELISLTGFGIGPETGVASQPDAQGRIPNQIAGVQVLFDGQPAPVLYAQARQINAVAPVELNGHSQTEISVVYNGATIGPVPATVMPNAIQGIFRLHPGQSSQAAAVNEDGTANGPSNPAAKGSVVSVWGTGFGLIEPSCVTGGPNPANPVNLAPGLGVLIADAPVPGRPAQFAPALYAGSAPGMACGIVQINFRVPEQAGVGAYEFVPWATTGEAGNGQTFAPATIGATIFVK